MKFTRDEFPIYEFLKTDIDSKFANHFGKYLLAARVGRDHDKYQLALGLYSLVIDNKIPNLPDDVAEKTLQQAYQLYEQGAHNGHGWSTLMTAVCCFYGQGRDKNLDDAEHWVWQFNLRWKHPIADELTGEIQKKKGGNSPGLTPS